MRKFGFLVAVLVFGSFLSCNYDQYHHYTIENRLSARDVSFTFNSEPITLEPGASVARRINSWDGRFTPQSIDFTGHEKSVKMIRKSRIFIFDDVVPINISVINTLPVDVTLTTVYLDNGSLTIYGHDTGTATVFMRNPHFCVSPTGYDIIVDMTFEDNMINAIIR